MPCETGSIALISAGEAGVVGIAEDAGVSTVVGVVGVETLATGVIGASDGAGLVEDTSPTAFDVGACCPVASSMGVAIGGVGFLVSISKLAAIDALTCSTHESR
jgi:hypothetical protein